jgi:hypothetical protein
MHPPLQCGAKMARRAKLRFTHFVALVEVVLAASELQLSKVIARGDKLFTNIPQTYSVR